LIVPTPHRDVVEVKIGLAEEQNIFRPRQLVNITHS